MKLPDFRLQRSTETATDSANDTVYAAFVTETDGGPVTHADSTLIIDPSTLALIGVRGKKDEITRVPALRGDTPVALRLVGVGEAELSPASLRLAAGALGRSGIEADELVVSLAELTANQLEAIASGYALGAYRFRNYITGDEPKRPARVSFVTAAEGDELASLERAIERARAIVSAVYLVRDLVNTPPNDLYPESFAALAVETAKGLVADVTVWDEDALARDGFGGHLAVGRGSSRPPRLVKLSHRPEGARAHLALVGKGITFDTGGLSLKPAASMVGMKFDMSGAAIALGVLSAVVALDLPIAITAWCCLAENMPSGHATRPDDIITIHGGTTVEVTNTDAEGRLVLADGIDAAGADEPDVIIDIATLTGAQVVALGDRTTGIMGNNNVWVDRVRQAAEAAGEPAWPMPIPDEARASLDSDVADIANAKPGNRSAGMLTAASFLEKFVPVDAQGEPRPWVHLDIAGPSNNDKAAYGVTPKGATGVMVRTLIELAEQLSKSD